LTLIALCGPAQCGKTSIANALSSAIGLPVESFAKPLKKMADLVCVPGSSKSDRREVLVAIGRHYRHHNPNHWIDSLISRLSPEGAIIDDVRYANEIRRILELGGIVFHIRREGVFPANDEEANSLREILADEWLMSRTHFIRNDGTIEDAAAKVLRVVGEKGAGELLQPTTEGMPK
jgi:hypothetical protein